MALKINQDRSRFRNIIKGKIRKNLKKYISKGEFIGRQGKDKISIPIPHITLPRFRYGDQQQGGVGQGDGEPGDPIGEGENQPGSGEAGNEEGDHALEVEVSIEELAEILGEELELPDIKPKGQKRIDETYQKVGGIRRAGPESLRNFKRTYQQSLKRMISTGTYNPKNPIVIPVQEDKRYRSWKTEYKPVTNAVIIYMMDVSGSMGEAQKEIVRIISFWIDTWLSAQYKGLESRFIIHDSIAKLVDRETFFRTRESGGTMISSAYGLCKTLIEKEYPPSEWNIYPFHFSDGDNWSDDDTQKCLALLNDFLLPCANMFAYGQVVSPYGSGDFIEILRQNFGDNSQLVTSNIEDKDAIMQSIKDFLGKGH